MPLQLDGKRQVTPFNIRSGGKLKSSAERTNRRDMSGRLKWILDTHRESVTEIICQTLQSSQFPSCIFSAHRGSADNTSSDYQRTAFVALLVDVKRQGNHVYTSVKCWRWGPKGQRKAGNSVERDKLYIKPSTFADCEVRSTVLMSNAWQVVWSTADWRMLSDCEWQLMYSL